MIDREAVYKLVDEARVKRVNKATYVRQELIKSNSALAGQTIRRNGHEYNALDYLLQDVDSYK